MLGRGRGNLASASRIVFALLRRVLGSIVRRPTLSVRRYTGTGLLLAAPGRSGLVVVPLVGVLRPMVIDAGEDPLFIARRLVILAAEDVGMADPQALSVAVATQQAVHFVGMPEARIPLAEATVFLASAPKSNSAYAAINRALDDVQRTRNEPVPLHLRNPVSGLMRDIGYGKEYKYSHDYDNHFAIMENLPDTLKERRYYEPGDQGYEAESAERLRQWWGKPDNT